MTHFIDQPATLYNSQLAQSVPRIIDPELTAARARIAKLEAALGDIAKQKTTDEITHQGSLRADWEGGFDTLVENAREALKP